MSHDFWIFAHPDDEIFGIPLWFNKENVSIFYFLVTHPPIRKYETQRLEERLVRRGLQIRMNFSPHRFSDGKVSQCLTKEALVDLLSQIESTKPDRILVLAAEKGHQDHDYVNHLARHISKRISADLVEVNAYSNASRRFGFHVMKAKRKSGFYVQNRISFACLAISIALNYRSQWKSWIGLLPGILIRYLQPTFNYSVNEGFQLISETSTALYEKRSRSKLDFEVQQQEHLEKLFEDLDH